MNIGELVAKGGAFFLKKKLSAVQQVFDAAPAADKAAFQYSVSGAPTSLQRLQSLLRTRPISSPILMLLPVTVTEGAAGAGPATATVRIVPWNGVTPQTATAFNSPYLWVYNASQITEVGLQLTMSSQEKFLFKAPVFATNAGGMGVQILRFQFDGQAFEILHSGQTMYYGIADGLAMTNGAVTVGVGSGSAAAWTKFDFGSRGLRTVTLHIFGRIGSIAVGANDSISAAPDDTGIKAVLHGDSYYTTAGQYGVGPGIEACLAAGITTFWGSGWGGTGYLQNGSGGAMNANTAFPELKNVPACDLWQVSLGINDQNANMPGLQSAVNTYFASVRAQFPGAVISANGPWCPKESQSYGATKYPQIRDAIKTGIQTVAGPWAFVDNLTGTWLNSAGATGSAPTASTSSTTAVNGGPSVNSGGQTPPQVGTWQTGEGYAGAPTGKGNGDLYVVADQTHPTAGGVTYLGRQIAEGWRKAILAL